MLKEFCQITVGEHLDARWSEWLDGWKITLQEDGTTLLDRSPVDRAALYGLLTKIRDLNLTLISVRCSHSNRRGMTA